MTISPTPFREPLRRTVLRTVIIAVVAAVTIVWWRRSWDRLPLATLLVFWFSFGGHWVEVLFLNVIRPRLSASRVAQFAVRAGVWFAGGVVLGYGMVLTAVQLGGLAPEQRPAWWFGGVALIAIELLAHGGMQLRGTASIYNGRG